MSCSGVLWLGWHAS